MSNSTQNDHETHTACIGRIKKEGASSTCCYCDPHDGCTLGMKPPTQNDPYDEFITSLGLDFRKGLGAIIGFHQLGKILRVFNKQVSDENRNELADARKEVMGKVEGMKTDKILKSYWSDSITSSSHAGGYLQAIDDVLATLREEEP